MSERAASKFGRLWRKQLTAMELDTQGQFNTVVTGDIVPLGDLFFEAFQGTVDDTGQTRLQWSAKASAMLSGRYGPCNFSASYVLAQGAGLLSACIVTEYEPYRSTLIAIVACSPTVQGSGVGTRIVESALASLFAQGYRDVCAKISDGNIVSGRLFEKCGFHPAEIVD